MSGPICPPRAGSRTGRRLRSRRCGSAGTAPVGSGRDRRLLGHARRFADRIDRRVLQGDKIPHGEKVFSIFEEHTRWIVKGKAGKKVELGVPVRVVEDGNGFVLDHEIMWSGGDTDVVAPLVRRCLGGSRAAGMQLRPGLPQPVEPEDAR